MADAGAPSRPPHSLARPVVVISQPMLFPWAGMFEQIRLADVYVHYPDVQFSKGSFTNRVQVKTAGGSRWLTLPLRDLQNVLLSGKR